MLCLVTDRRRFATRQALLDQIGAAAQAGVDLIQIRENDLEAADLIALVREALSLVEGTRAKVLVNDRVDVALAAGAHGVQLKERSMPAAEVRAIAPREFVIGCSVHTVAAALARKDADFLIAGTVRPTASKRGVDNLDEVGLTAIVDAAAGQPVLGIGGLDLPSIPLLAASCAAGLAGVSAFVPNEGEDVRLGVQKRVTALRFALETLRAGT